MRAGRSTRANLAKPLITTTSPPETVSVIVSMNACRLASAVRLSVSVRSASAATRSLRFMVGCSWSAGGCRRACSMPPNGPERLHRGHISRTRRRGPGPGPEGPPDGHVGVQPSSRAADGEVGGSMNRQARILVAELIGTMILILGGPGTAIFGQYARFRHRRAGGGVRVRLEPAVRGVPLRAHLGLPHQPGGDHRHVGAQAHRRQGRARRTSSVRSSAPRSARSSSGRSSRPVTTGGGQEARASGVVRRCVERVRRPLTGALRASGRWSSWRSCSPRSSSW